MGVGTSSGWGWDGEKGLLAGVGGWGGRGSVGVGWGKLLEGGFRISMERWLGSS